jgi:hypothetical protein
VICTLRKMVRAVIVCGGCYCQLIRGAGLIYWIMRKGTKKGSLDLSKWTKLGITEETIGRLRAGFKRFDPEATGSVRIAGGLLTRLESLCG